jgi:DUF4097 and DUF4098 domain-containing protein YvlB
MTSIHFVLTLAAMATVPAFTADKADRPLNCDGRSRSDERQARHCEMREFTLAAVPRLTVDGRQNGGIAIKGQDRSDVLVRAKVETWAPNESDARGNAGQVTVATSGGNVRADAPDFGRERGWAVSYEILVPRRADVSLKAHNGGIAIANVSGNMDFDTVNGGVSLVAVAGTVRGKTTNGGVNVDLTGSRWEGGELNVVTTNGGVSLSVPENYSARLETRTVNGRVNFDFPLTLQGRIDPRELSVNLGSGGPLVRAVTTNGGVSIRRKS